MSAARVSVCFVCLGNICRSPTAEGVFRGVLKREGLSELVEVDSAGTAGYHEGERADSRSRMFAKKRGYELSSVARKFTSADFERFDYVLAMDTQNLVDLAKMAERTSATPKNLGLFRDFEKSGKKGQSVPDPYYGGDRGFDEVLDQCERACEGLLEHLRQHHGI